MSPPETGKQGTGYTSSDFSTPTFVQPPVGQPQSGQTYYKLLAYDMTIPSVPAPVRWVSNQISFANAPAGAHGGTLVNLTIEGTWTA